MNFDNLSASELMTMNENTLRQQAKALRPARSHFDPSAILLPAVLLLWALLIASIR